MRILIDGRPMLERQRAGVATYAVEMARALAAVAPEHDYQIWASGLKAAWPADLPRPASGLAYRRTHLPNKLVNAGFRFAAWPRLEDYAGKADFAWLPNLNFLATRLPYAITVHDLSFVRYPDFFTPKTRAWHAALNIPRLLKDAARVIAVSEHTKADLAEIYGVAPEKITVASPGVGPEFRPQAPEKIAELRARLGLPEKYFLFVGAKEPRKNLLGLIEAFERVPGGASLVLAGASGWMNKAVFRRAAASPKRDRILCLGYVAAADKPALYSGALALAYPSFYEGFGIPPVEAMACGTPVLAGHASSFPEVVGDAGVLVDPHNLTSIADGLTMIAEDEKTRALLRTRGLERAKRYTWEASAARLEAALVDSQ